MRVLINPRRSALQPQPMPAELVLIRQPSHRMGLAISAFVGLVIPVIPCLLLSIGSTLFRRAGISTDETIPWWIIFPVLGVCVVTHELLHVIGDPGWGRSAQSIVLIWPRRLQLGVYYDGFMKRSRWLVMRLAPLVGLTLVPTLFLLLAYPSELSFFWQQFVVLVILVNSLGAGSDLAASIIVARQVPTHGEIGIWNGRACWRSSEAVLYW